MNKSIFGQLNNVNPIVAQFNQFKQGIKGDPKAQVESLLRSGKMSQQQYNQLSQMAQSFSQLIK